MKTKPEFTKGDAVVLISNWDRCGTVQIQRCHVLACGAKQMHLNNDATGRPMGDGGMFTRYRPGREQYDHAVVVPITEDFMATALAIANTVKEIARRRLADWEQTIANPRASASVKTEAARTILRITAEPRILITDDDVIADMNEYHPRTK